MMDKLSDLPAMPAQAAPDDAARAAIARDLDVLGRYEPRRLAFYLRLYPHLEAYVTAAGGS